MRCKSSWTISFRISRSTLSQHTVASVSAKSMMMSCKGTCWLQHTIAKAMVLMWPSTCRLPTGIRLSESTKLRINLGRWFTSTRWLASAGIFLFTGRAATCSGLRIHAWASWWSRATLDKYSTLKGGISTSDQTVVPQLTARRIQRHKFERYRIKSKWVY